VEPAKETTFRRRDVIAADAVTGALGAWFPSSWMFDNFENASSLLRLAAHERRLLHARSASTALIKLRIQIRLAPALTHAEYRSIAQQAFGSCPHMAYRVISRRRANWVAFR
jgi:hypothetical protein